MARNGKIARLPLHLRTELNQRLSEGEPGTDLVVWLNREAGLFLKEDPEGRRIPITEQNLSEWRSGGYQDWLRHEEARQFTEELAEQAGELDKAADGKSISDRFGALLAVDMARLAKKFLQQETDDEKRWDRLKEISKELSRLRRNEHRAVSTWIKRQQWERRRDREDYEEEEQIRKEVRREGIAPLLAMGRVRNLGELYGGGPEGMETAAMVLEVQEDLEPGSLVNTVRAYNADLAKAASAKVRAGQATKVRAGRATKVRAGRATTPAVPVLSSKPVAKDQGRTSEGDKSEGGRSCGSQTRGPGDSDRIRPNPTKPARWVLSSKPVSKDQGEAFHEEMPPVDALVPRASHVAASGTGVLQPNPSESDQIKPKNVARNNEGGG